MMIKRFAALATSVALTATAASAGGPVTPVMEAEPVAVAVALPAAAPSWTGGYLGGNLSFGDGEVTAEGFDGALAEPDGASAAIRGGYDWQFGQFVLGLGAEYNVGKYKSGLNGDLGGLDIGVEMKNTATVFGRVGYAVNDQFLAYGLLGHTRTKGNVFATDGESFFTEGRTLKGTTFGLGGEYRFTPRVSGYAEYNHTDFGSVPDTDGELKAKLGQIKLGANFRF
ncbi:porin family protein [Pseudorhodobacter sp. MZDSW-24AT]|nr:porin family protein [Pseudorhodobacter sp. MZDSW-24AT]